MSAIDEFPFDERIKAQMKRAHPESASDIDSAFARDNASAEPRQYRDATHDEWCRGCNKWVDGATHPWTEQPLAHSGTCAPSDEPRQTCEHGNVLCGACEDVILNPSDEPRESERVAAHFRAKRERDDAVDAIVRAVLAEVARQDAVIARGGALSGPADTGTLAWQVFYAADWIRKALRLSTEGVTG